MFETSCFNASKLMQTPSKWSYWCLSRSLISRSSRLQYWTIGEVL